MLFFCEKVTFMSYKLIIKTECAGLFLTTLSVVFMGKKKLQTGVSRLIIVC